MNHISKNIDELIAKWREQDKELFQERAGIPATEHVPHQIFWASSNKVVSLPTFDFSLPCECTEAA